MHHEGALHTGQTCERLGHELRHRLTVGTDQHEGRRGRVGERAQDIEHRAHAERLPHRADRLHRRVVVRREQEGEPGGRKTRAGLGLIERQRQAELLEHIGAARTAGDGTVAVLDDRHPTGRDQQRGAGGDVDAARSVTARADDVDGAGLQRRVHHRTPREFAHRASEPAQFAGDDTLAAQRREQRAGERGREPGVGERMQRPGCLGFGEVGALEHALEMTPQRRQIRHRGDLRADAGSSPSMPDRPATARSRDGTARPRPPDRDGADP